MAERAATGDRYAADGLAGLTKRSDLGDTATGSQAETEPEVDLSVTDVRRLWPEVLQEVKSNRRFTWILLSQNTHVADLRNGTLLLAMSNAGARDSFTRGGNEAVLHEALVAVMGAAFPIETMVDERKQA